MISRAGSCPAYDDNGSGTPRGGCVVGRCWEACSSLIPVSLLVSPHGSLDRPKSLNAIFPYVGY